ncbi:Fibrinogen-like protein A,Ryncolin-4,Angiopoietin-related protein 7,Ficolin-1-B,Techylectin-5A,Ficolin-2,Ryncolin-1,Tenascin-R,Fibrinogen-like protein 1,Fibrinogen C domain-containing protein 1-A,Tenascin-N,Ryncolin-3,Tenascin,Fibrinogen C domain-containing protein 1,Ryncolin-2,Techylectin-5B,Angiopoietin-related protein 2,Microfibril-associated glycoprotein 4,Fibrinogen alpha chain,Ficolin-1-A,Ficolin-1,Fibrinogen C domain-containing protein 1-B,Angiopoietin-4 [Mytilus coruscus]|uniref:Fibrinogen C-terminal domain-containing protein n=1 Tax=Mytilus coruscus TaxID=42192 RepID=A0A6J8C850_MYTCO|nr:Fibrinogen-like protein A,Ryncolin-4,Angiopoietin-related protein 7,Ficolin-1-B,Techylectin-5A,Ficolin-2,Ryncolin-1,Tenascin-R,Fibrinogen-like protein 1,Fibrinogen C domain-containing protein 1-A,Tenascin-N,Ryncolin-3,Tenascin,Fibrinogen C domain-containing protein 1,Ryncolin-2,Techylectin-5B,Angiopoietin-related protein 2,Microfibril-associated glycoprotein 4,Fibrinogen alpha chain,Ficolin-1-A,Ficolin-1,Fibrinogen C domain-containing protein 1-B,Angiopoietin-4 [Mytilus coruscus]
MYGEWLFTAFLLVFGKINCHRIIKDKCATDVANKVANLITEIRSECTLTPPDDLDFRPSDCGDLKKAEHKSGVYKIYPDRTSSFQVFCDMENYEGGWTVIQKRTNGYVGFYRDWEAYKDGFGDLQTDFWLGNKYLNKLTEQGYYILRIDMWDFAKNQKYAIYEKFIVNNERSGYKLEVAGYVGNAGDALSYHNGYRFSTKDKDSTSRKCATKCNGGWWYRGCHYANLNGNYLKGTHRTSGEGINWKPWKGYYYSLKATRMMIRRA